MKDDRHVKCPHCKGDIHKIALEMKNQVRKEFMGKITRDAIKHQVFGAVKEFRNDHPDILNPAYQNSLVKRVTGQVYNYLSRHKQYFKLERKKTK